MIPLDFVAGTHGHFVEYVLNRSLGFFAQDLDLFTDLGTSHQRSKTYIDSRKICCDHWFENARSTLGQVSHVIRIVFDSDDLLWVTGLSLARAADLNINNDDLHINTRSKLNNDYYRDTLREIYKAYAFLDPSDESIPRNVLREFFKFGFRQPTINGYWCKLHDMLSVPVKNQYQIKLRHIYDLKKFRQELHGIADWLELPCAADQFLEPLHTKFISHLGDTNPNSLCDRIVSCVIAKTNTSIPKLSLLQESYVNARLESIFQKEMPFHEVDYFTNTKDIIQYIEHQAPDL